MPDISELKRDYRTLKRLLREFGIEEKVFKKIQTTARRSGRRQTGQYKSNRESRWKLDPNDPQYGTEEECRLIELKLVAQLFEFKDAPDVPEDAKSIISKYLGYQPVKGAFRDALTKEQLSYTEFIEEVMNPTPGKSKYHLGHEDPTISSKHISSNISWRTSRSNLIQGDLRLNEARARIVEIIARYFNLGDIRIEGEEDRR